MKLFKQYFHTDDDALYEKGLLFGLSGEALQGFERNFYELNLDCELNTETGEVMILAVNGAKLINPVKA